MPPPNATILIDTNAILEAHDKRCWDALIGQYQVETVEMCVVETQTGFQNRQPDDLINEQMLREQLNAVHHVTDVEIAAIDLLDGPQLDDGEKALWAHALTRDDAWVLCGPDRASMRFGYEQNLRDRLVSLGGLLTEIGFRPPNGIRRNYSREWLDQVLYNLEMGIL